MTAWRPLRHHGDGPASADSVVPDGPRGSAPLAHASSATALLVVAAVSTLVGLFFAIPALVLGLVAVLLQRRSDPRSTTLATWGWVAYVVGAVLMLLAGVVLVLIAGYAASGNG